MAPRDMCVAVCVAVRVAVRISVCVAVRVAVCAVVCVAVRLAVCVATRFTPRTPLLMERRGLCCSVLQCVAVWCSVVQYVLQHILLHVAVCCSVLQCVANGAAWCCIF